MRQLVTAGGKSLVALSLSGVFIGTTVTPSNAAPDFAMADANGPASTKTLRQRIVLTAREQIGYHETGNNCNKYTGTCQPWCGRFTQWTYWKVDHAYTNLLLVPQIWSWAAKRKKTYRKVSSVKSGDLIVWKSRKHMGVVTKVSGGKIRVTSGNLSDAVGEHWYGRGTFYGGIRP